MDLSLSVLLKSHLIEMFLDVICKQIFVSFFCSKCCSFFSFFFSFFKSFLPSSDLNLMMLCYN